MCKQHTVSQTGETQLRPNRQIGFDYDHTAWPRDFDIRIDVAEQREVLEHFKSSLKNCSEVEA